MKKRERNTAAEGRAQACLQRAVAVSNGRGAEPVISWILTTGDLHALADYSPSEVRVLMDKVLCGPRVDLALEELRHHNALHFLHLEGLPGFGGGAQGHKDLWEHVKKVVAQSDSRPLLRWAALYHDVGKIKTISREGEKVSFHGHEAVSTRLFKAFADSSRLFRASEEQRITDVIFNLGRVESFEGQWTDSAVRRLMTELGDCLEDVIALSSADITTGRDDKRRRILDSIETLKSRIEDVRAADSAPRLPKGLGIVLSDELGIPRDRSLKAVMDELETMLRSGEIPKTAVIADYVRIAREKIVGSKG